MKPSEVRASGAQLAPERPPLQATPRLARLLVVWVALMCSCVVRAGLANRQPDEQTHQLAGLDEEITLDALLQRPVGHDAIGSLHSDSSARSSFEANDPFAVTFDDYLRETSRSAETNANSAHRVGKQAQHIDFIFPPSATKPSQEEASASGSTGTRLLFAWRAKATSKCSRPCGRGLRLNQLSCVDLKYDVRVEDELCLEAKLVKPSELGADFCNQVDCEPRWVPVDFQECNADVSADSRLAERCRPGQFKRAQCMMTNANGLDVYLEDFRCNSSERIQLGSKMRATSAASAASTTGTTVTTSPPTTTVAPSSTKSVEDELASEFTMEELLDSSGERSNDILSNIRQPADAALEEATKGRTPRDEPFYEPGPWSACSGAPCGQLGLRHRHLACRLYLSRSSKFADLPSSSCHEAQAPDTREPCYMDCSPETGDLPGVQPANSSGSASVGSEQELSGEEDEEIIDDPEMTRFVWRRDGWTKCSSDCLGGLRESIVECWDKLAEQAASSTLCDQSAKPKPVVEGCKDIPCQPEWRVEPFSNCSRTCGSAGVRTRSVVCVQQVPTHGGSSFMIVSNDLCIQAASNSNATQMPHRIEPCNRVDCRPEWSVGGWSGCSRRCGEGLRNRTVICVQEFASREGPQPGSSYRRAHRASSRDLTEAITLSAESWHPGKAIQVPFHECYEEYRAAPAIEERCFAPCDREPYIDADPQQNFHVTQEALKRRTITLRVGGKAQVLEGKNVKIKCRLMNKQETRLMGANRTEEQQVEWRKDGVRIFVNRSTGADKHYNQDDAANSILDNDLLMADEPNSRRMTNQPTTNANNNNNNRKNQLHSLLSSRSRTLTTRSWNSLQANVDAVSFSFVPQIGGRFSLIKENALRIKKLKSDDSGTYTCSYGQLSESIELKVLGRRDFLANDERNNHNFGPQ